MRENFSEVRPENSSFIEIKEVLYMKANMYLW